MSTNNTYTGIVWRKGKKVILRPFEEGDLVHFQRWINDPETNNFLFITWPMTIGAEQNWFKTVSKSDPNHIHLTICTYEGEVIGSIGMDIDPAKQSASTGTVIGPAEYRSQGYGTDAKMLLLDYAFNWRGLRKVTSSIFNFNGRSQNYAKKCGYRHMATIEKEHFRHGEWRDEELFVVFREDWLPVWEKYTQSWQPDWMQSDGCMK